MVAPRNKTCPSFPGQTQDRAIELCRSLQCPEKTPDRAWHRLKTVSGTEKTVCGKLQERKIPCYYPSVRVKSNTLFEHKTAMFPGNVFAALTKKDLRDLSNEFFIEGIEENQPKTRADLIDWDIVFMVFAERLNCFYPFQEVSSGFPSPRGIPGHDFYEMRGQGGEYILLIPEKNGSIVNAFFRFDSIPANIEFTLPQALWSQILSIR
jgi:hypothetical protein